MERARQRRDPPEQTNHARRSTNQLGAIFEAMADAVIVYDAEGRIVQMNDTASALMQMEQRRAYLSLPVDEREPGLEMRDMEGRPLKREQWPAVRALHGERLAAETAPDIRVHMVDGQDLVLNISGAPIHDASGQLAGAVCVVRDVTERRRLAQELAERASQIESMFDAMADGVVMCDVTGQIVRMNAAHRQLLGYDVTHEAAATHLEDNADRYAPRDLENHPLPKEDWPINRLLRGETLTGAQAVEMRIRTLDGRELTVQVSGAPVRDAAGHIIGAVSATRDITERRRLEQQRSDILRVVAHDLMNPITGMRLYFHTQLTRQRKGQPPLEPDERLWGMLNANLARMEHLVNDLRAVTSIESGALRLERQRCDLTALCHQEIALQQAMVPERAIQFTAPEEPVEVDADEQRVGQVVANLLSNALKYSPADRPIVITLDVNDETARLAVSDEGPGIPPPELKRIWEQFHRIEGIKALDGTQSLGLGLYICRAIVEAHEGEIGVESMVGAGSTFWFRLPLATAMTDDERAG